MVELIPGQGSLDVLYWVGVEVTIVFVLDLGFQGIQELYWKDARVKYHEKR